MIITYDRYSKVVMSIMVGSGGHDALSVIALLHDPLNIVCKSNGARI